MSDPAPNADGIDPKAQAGFAPSNGSETVVEWPTDEGIWIGWIDGVGWFPMQTMYLRDDLPSREAMEEERRTGIKWIGEPLAVVAQWLESETSWPYTFKSCHPAKRWRRPTDDEMMRALIFYGKSHIRKLFV